MARPRIILADTDANYLMSIQLKFIEDFFEKIDLEIVTDEQYFESLFETPQKAAILVVSENLYDSSLKKHNIAKVFVMTEQNENDGTEDLTIDKIYKYTSIKDIFKEIVGKSESVLNIDISGKKDPQIIVVTSAAGGVGKTTVAMGLSACLARDYKKVLYINCDHLQGYLLLLKNQTVISNNEIYSKLARNTGLLYNDIKHVIRNEIFSYLPPLKASLMSLNISAEVFLKIAVEAKKSGDYDFVILDTNNVFDEQKASLLDAADRVITVLKQNKASVIATNALVSSINGIKGEKYLFVCNDFTKQDDNALISTAINPKFNVNEYIDHIVQYESIDCAGLAEQSSIRRIVYLID